MHDRYPVITGAAPPACGAAWHAVLCVVCERVNIKYDCVLSIPPTRDRRLLTFFVIMIPSIRNLPCTKRTAPHKMLVPRIGAPPGTVYRIIAIHHHRRTYCYYDVDKALSFCAFSSTVIRRPVFLCASSSFNQVHR